MSRISTGLATIFMVLVQHSEPFFNAFLFLWLLSAHP